LEDRLSSYKRYKELSVTLGKMFGNFLYFAKEKKEMRIIFSPTNEIGLDSLKNALNESLANIPQKEKDLPKVTIEKIISLEEMVEKLSERIKISLKTSFTDFAKSSSGNKNFSNIDKSEKVNVIVSFLAMLELVKRGVVRVNQESNFQDISIESENAGVPMYY
jgi:segregation and condensation protein A